MAELIQKTDTLNAGREKLNKAIEHVDTFQRQIDEIVVNGDSSVEAAQARMDLEGKIYTTLKQRLDTEQSQVTSQLEEIKDDKVDKIYVDVRLSQKLNQDDVLSMGNMGQDIKEAMTGGSVAVVGRNAVLNENIVNEEVTASKTTFLKPSPNLLNRRKYRQNGYYSASDGGWRDASGNKASEFIRCNKNEKYYLNTSNKPSIVFYNLSFNFVASIPANGWTDFFVVPNNENIAFMIVNLSSNDANDNILMLTKDIKPTRFISFDEVEPNGIVFSQKTSNRRLLLFGDSITETASMNDDGSNYVENTRSNYPKFLNESLKFLEMVNYAKSGASYRDRGLQFRQFIGNQIDTAITNNIQADIIIIASGTNDDGASFDANLDDYETAMNKEINQLDKSKIYQSIRYAFYRIRENWPDAICFASTPLQKASKEQNFDLNEAITKMANRYNFIIVDCGGESGIVRDFEIDGANGRYLKDGLHPNENGQKLQAKLFESYLNMYVR